MTKLLKITNNEMASIIGESKNFPKYTTQIMNLANQNSQGTRPRVVGQLSDLIQECPHKTYEEWKDWYLKKHPNAVDNATKKIVEMVDNLKISIEKIDENIVKEWVEDLVLVKTFIGLCFQDVILKKISATKHKKYRLATPKEESKG